MREALTQGEKLIIEYPSQSGLSLLMADIHYKAGSPDMAIAYWKRELEFEPGNLICLNNLAWELGVRQGRFSEAKVYHEALRKRAFADPRIFDTLGWLSALMGKTDEAGDHLQKALLMAPDQPSVLYRLARVRLLAGDAEGARATVEKAFSSPWPFPENAEALRFRDSLSTL